MKVLARKATPEQKRILYQASFAICEKLKIDLPKTRVIQITLKNLEDVDGQTWTYDNVIYIDIDYGLASYPSQMFEVLAHELVHARQYINGDFHFVRKKEHWKGSPIPVNHNMIDQVLQLPSKEYKNLPWEKEAYKIAGQLLTKHLRPFILNWKKTIKKG